MILNRPTLPFSGGAPALHCLLRAVPPVLPLLRRAAPVGRGGARVGVPQVRGVPGVRPRRRRRRQDEVRQVPQGEPLGLPAAEPEGDHPGAGRRGRVLGEFNHLRR